MTSTKVALLDKEASKTASSLAGKHKDPKVQTRKTLPKTLTKDYLVVKLSEGAETNFAQFKVTRRESIFFTSCTEARNSYIILLHF